MLPFWYIPPRLVIEMAKTAVFWLNGFPATDGVADTLSPRTLVTGLSIDHNRHSRYAFSQYVETHETHDNGMSPRTIGALATHPLGNAQGGFYYFSLTTGRIIRRTHATPLPMPKDVIDRVHRIARQQRANPSLVFADRCQLAVDEPHDEGDGAYEPSEWDSDSDDDSDAPVAQLKPPGNPGVVHLDMGPTAVPPANPGVGPEVVEVNPPMDPPDNPDNHENELPAGEADENELPAGEADELPAGKADEPELPADEADEE